MWNSCGGQFDRIICSRYSQFEAYSISTLHNENHICTKLHNSMYFKKNKAWTSKNIEFWDHVIMVNTKHVFFNVLDGLGRSKWDFQKPFCYSKCLFGGHMETIARVLQTKDATKALFAVPIHVFGSILEASWHAKTNHKWITALL